MQDCTNSFYSQCSSQGHLPDFSDSGNRDKIYQRLLHWQRTIKNDCLLKFQNRSESAGNIVCMRRVILLACHSKIMSEQIALFRYRFWMNLIWKSSGSGREEDFIFRTCNLNNPPVRFSKIRSAKPSSPEPGSVKTCTGIKVP